MEKNLTEADLKAARAAIRLAEDARALHRKRTYRGSQQREADLSQATDRVKKAMLPIRSFLGRAPYMQPSAAHDELVERAREASKQLQKERRKCWKMQNHRKIR